MVAVVDKVAEVGLPAEGMVVGVAGELFVLLVGVGEMVVVVVGGTVVVIAKGMIVVVVEGMVVGVGAASCCAFATFRRAAWYSALTWYGLA